jgi:hypothetical protein
LFSMQYTWSVIYMNFLVRDTRWDVFLAI